MPFRQPDGAEVGGFLPAGEGELQGMEVLVGQHPAQPLGRGAVLIQLQEDGARHGEAWVPPGPHRPHPVDRIGVAFEVGAGVDDDVEAGDSEAFGVEGGDATGFGAQFVRPLLRDRAVEADA